MDNQTEGEQEFDDSNADPTYEEEEVVLKSKKRKKNPERWLQNLRKLKRNSGEPYISKSGKAVPARQYSDCACKERCTGKLTDQVKQKLLNDFNTLANKNIQDAYLHGLISVYPVAR